MTSSRSSAEGQEEAAEGDSFDFAEAAQTLVQLQKQLKEIESANGTIEDAQKLASQLEQTSDNVASAGHHLETTTEKLASAYDKLAQRPTVSPEALKKLATEVQDLKQALDSFELDANSGRQRREVVSDAESHDAYLWGFRRDTLGIMGLLVVLIAFQVVLWGSRPDSSVQENSAPHAQLEPVETLSQVDVQVLNGVGVGGVAGDMKAFFEEEGISVVGVGNAPVGTFAETKIFVHQNAFGVAKQIASRLNLPHSRVHPGPIDESGTDLTVIIGDDYKSLPSHRPKSTQ